MQNMTKQPSTQIGSSQSHSNPRSSQNTKPTSNSHGKSKYAQKSRGKKNKSVSKPRGPVNQYTSVCCHLPATKPPTASPVAPGSKDKNGLGKFRCSGCKKRCSVTVSKFHVTEATVGNVTVTATVPAEEEVLYA